MKTKNIYSIFILVALFLSFCLKAGFALNSYETSAFNRANVYYEQANYDEAIKQYSSVLESGYESGNLFYNLGNCYFKKGELGRAILNYEKARRLIPKDLDLESNYEYACSLVKGQTVVSKKSLLLGALNNLFEKFTINGLTILLSLLYILILVNILISLFFKQFKKYVLMLIVFMGVFFITCFIGLNSKRAFLNKEAIILAEQVDAKFEPIDKATTYFTLYAGMKIEVIESRDNWYKIKRQDDKAGWVQNGALAIY